MAAGRCLRANQEHNHTDDGQREAEIAEPETVFGLGLAVDATGATTHPEVGEYTTHLLANDGSDDHTQELETQLLGVQFELLFQQLGHLDCCEDASKQEDHGVCAGWNENGGVAGHGQWTDEFIP